MKTVLATVIMAGVIFAAGSATAYEEPKGSCTRSPSEPMNAKAYRVAGEGRTYFHNGPNEGQSPNASCPGAGQACRKKAFVVKGDWVVSDRAEGDYACATYTDLKGRMTTGWIRANLIERQDSRPDWTGEWLRTDGSITIAAADARHLKITGNAVWVGNASTGNVNSGQFAVTVPSPVENSHLDFGVRSADDTLMDFKTADTAGECAVKMAMAGPYLVVRDNMRCGGLNLTFNGVYHRKSAPSGKSAADVQSVKEDLSAFTPAGATILDSLTGDLDGNGSSDALVVFSPPGKGSKASDQDAPRSVVILHRDKTGQLRQVARNDRIVPCAQCGGIKGDPYGYSRLEPGRFTIVIEGGSRERWADEITFKYAPSQKDWLLDTVTREAIDTATGTKKRRLLTAKDFGIVSFKDFDRAALPALSLP